MKDLKKYKIKRVWTPPHPMWGDIALQIWKCEGENCECLFEGGCSLVYFRDEDPTWGRLYEGDLNELWDEITSHPERFWVMEDSSIRGVPYYYIERKGIKKTVK